jgi:hypothetical protein
MAMTEDEFTSLEMLADYECPECGPMVGPDCAYEPLTEDEALAVFGGDDEGVLRCPFCFTDEGDEAEELELTAEAAAANLAWLQEKLAALPTPPSAASQGVEPQ